MTPTPNPLAPYTTWVDLLLNREPVLAREWERVEDGVSAAKQFEFARAELDALRDRARLLDAIVRRCFRIDADIGVVSIDCPSEDELRTALQEPQP